MFACVSEERGRGDHVHGECQKHHGHRAAHDVKGREPCNTRHGDDDACDRAHRTGDARRELHGHGKHRGADPDARGGFGKKGREGEEGGVPRPRHDGRDHHDRKHHEKHHPDARGFHGSGRLNEGGDAAQLVHAEREEFRAADETHGRGEDLAHTFEDGLGRRAAVLEGALREEVDEEGDENRHDDARLKRKLHVGVDHRREDDEKEERQHRQDRVMGGARTFEGLSDVLLFFDGTVRELHGVATVEPALHEEVSDRNRCDDAEGHGNLARDEVRDDVHLHQVGRTHRVRRGGAEVETAGRTDHGRGGGAGNAERNEERIDGGHEQKPETDRGIDEKGHELADHVRDGEKDVGRANRLQGLDAELHERLRGADAVHVDGEARDQHDVETESRKARAHERGECFAEVEPEEVRRLVGGHGHRARRRRTDEHYEARKEENDRRIVVLEHAVGDDRHDRERNKDSEHRESPFRG